MAAASVVVAVVLWVIYHRKSRCRCWSTDYFSPVNGIRLDRRRRRRRHHRYCCCCCTIAATTKSSCGAFIIVTVTCVTVRPDQNPLPPRNEWEWEINSFVSCTARFDIPPGWSSHRASPSLEPALNSAPTNRHFLIWFFCLFRRSVGPRGEFLYTLKGSVYFSYPVRRLPAIIIRLYRLPYKKDGPWLGPHNRDRPILSHWKKFFFLRYI